MIQPHDQQVVHRTLELKIQSKFDKEAGGLIMVDTEVLQKENEPIHAAVIGYMIISGLYVWAQKINLREDDPHTKAQAEKILPLIAEMLKVIEFVNPTSEVKNLLSQLYNHEGNPVSPANT